MKEKSEKFGMGLRKARWLVGVSVTSLCLIGLTVSAELIRIAPVTNGGSGELDSAALKTDAETDRLFSKAEEFVELDRFDLASVIWQKVLDEYGDNLITRDEWKMETLDNLYRKYLTVREDLESSLPNLDPGALQGYRLSADAEAKALLASSRGGSQRFEALAEVVRRYFLSSVGDDAAYELGCLKMERHEFFPALYYFRRILDSHPDPSIPRSELLIRIAVARAYVGDLGPAEEAMKELAEDIGTVDPTAIRAVNEMIASKVDNTGKGLGDPAGSEAKPAGILASDLSEDWVQPFKLNLGELAGLFQDRNLNSGGNEMSRAQLLTHWKNSSLTPTGNILVYDGRLYFKNANRLVCVSAETGDIEWLGHPNDFAFDKVSASQGQQRHQISLFKDRVHQAMGIRGDKIFTLQGRPQDIGGSPVAPAAVRRTAYGMLIGRHRDNWLAAYHRVDGRLRWYRQAKEETDDDSVEACFIGGPAFYESLMLIPMLKDGIVYLAGINPVDGKTIWLSHLCQEPMGSVRAECPVKVVVDAGEAYVATGSGVVFALDALSGSVRWCVRYPRSGRASQVNRGYGAQATVSGWSEDDIVVSGDQIVVLGCDMDYVFSLKRSDGGIAWESARSPFGDETAGSYVIGKSGDRMFVGGPRVVRCYDIRGGRLLWQKELTETSYGRGTVAADGIYVPIDSSIIRLGLEKGEILDKATFTSPTPEPIGNLTASGKRLFGFGLERVYSFGGLEQRFESLQREIESGELEAYRTRMRLHLQVGNRTEALKDLNGHFNSLVDKGDGLAAANVAYDGIGELGILEESPSEALNWVLRESDATAGTGESDLEEVTGRRRALLGAVFTEVEKKRAEVPSNLLLDVAPLCSEQFLLYGGRRAIAVAAKDADVSQLESVLSGDSLKKKVLASAAIRAKMGEGAIPKIKEVMGQTTDEELRLHLSTDLINLGDREGLAGLADLLVGEDAGIRRVAALRLKLVSGENIIYNPNGDLETRKQGAELWKDWIAGAGSSAKLNLPLAEGPPYQGHSYVVPQTGRQNILVELDRDGKEINRTEYSTTIYSLQKLDDGNVLISFADGVREYAQDGTKVWEVKERLTGYKVARRLSNGNTIVGQYGARLTEYDSTGAAAKVWREKLGSYAPIELTPSGSLLICDHQNRKVEEVGKSGVVESVLELPHNVYWACKGAGNTTVVAFGDQNKVAAYGPDKKQLWSVSGLSYPRYIQALPNGNFAILHQQGIKEVDANGKDVNQVEGRYNQLYRF